MATENSIYRIHPEVLSDQNPQPAGDVGVSSPQNPAAQVNPPAFDQDAGFDASRILQIWVVILSSTTGSVHSTMPVDTDVVGVRFWGNERSSWAQIKVDGIIPWVGNTQNLRNYLLIFSEAFYVTSVETVLCSSLAHCLS